MEPTDLNKLLVSIAAVVSGVGAIDAALGHQFDLLAVFLLGTVLQVALLVRIHGRRPSVPLRADLVAWLRDRSASQGEPLGALADRCLASCRADLDRG